MLVDLEKLIPKSEEYIYDYVHYTDKGSIKVAEYVYEVMRSLFDKNQEEDNGKTNCLYFW